MENIQSLYKEEYERLGHQLCWVAYRLGWKIDHLRSIGDSVFVGAADWTRHSEELLEFLRSHSQPMAMKLVTYQVECQGTPPIFESWDEYHDGFLFDMVDCHTYLRENHPEVLKGIPRNCKRSMIRYHDWLADKKAELEPDYGLPRYPELEPKVKDLLGFKGVIPSSTQELKEIGKRLDICVGAYGQRCLKQKSVVIHFAGPRGEYTAEIDKADWSLVQFKGRKNSEAPVSLAKELQRRLGLRSKF